MGVCSSRVTTNLLYLESLLTCLFLFPRIDAAYFHNDLASIHVCNSLHVVTNLISGSVGSGTESDSDDSVPDLEEQDSAQTQTQQAQVRVQSGLEYRQLEPKQTLEPKPF